MTALGIRIEFLKQKWPDLLKMGRAGKLQMWPVGWINTYGEGDAFMQLLYSKNIGQSNYSRFATARVRRALPEVASACPTGPSATRSTARWPSIVAAYNPWDLGVYRIENTLVRPWVLGYKKHVNLEHAVEVPRRRRRAPEGEEVTAPRVARVATGGRSRARRTARAARLPTRRALA